MKNSQVIALVIGSCVVTFIASVLFAMSLATIKPKQLAKVIKDDPKTFFKALEETHKEVQKIQAKQKQEEARKKLDEQIENPLPIETEGRVTFGNEAAPITIVEFSDFQCPFCSQAAERMSALREKYDGKVKLVYKNLPLVRIHPFAKPAAEYFEAVALISHDKAREFHDEIFYNFDKYAQLRNETEINKAIKDIIKKIGLKMKTVKENLEVAKKTVQADIEEANKLKVGGTPSFFVNGIDAKDIGIQAIIDKLLTKMEDEE